MEQESILNAALAQSPLIGSAVAWLSGNGANPHQLAEAAIERLRRRGRALSSDRRARYATKVLLGEFLARWAAKHRGRTVAALWDDKEEREKELHPFNLALIAAGDEQAFRRLARHFVRKRVVERVGLSIGTPDEFSAFVAENTHTLAAYFLKNFDSTRPRSALKAVLYLQKTAVSWYLRRRTKPIRTDAPNLGAYLATSIRLSRRTVLAAKLAYLPTLLTAEERQVLREQYGFTGSIGQLRPIKELARRLGFRSPAALSRKLYRLRTWCRKSAPPPKPGAGEEGQS